MTESDDVESDTSLRRLLSSADPAHSLPSADPSRVSAILEETMSQSAPERQSTSRSRWLLLGGVAAAAVVATFVAIGVSNSGDGTDTDIPTAATTNSGTVTELVAAPAMDVKCLPPSAADAAQQSVAFEGVVTEVADGTVTLRPLHFYKGTETSRVTIAEHDEGMSEGPAPFEVGQSYIVGANDGRVAICGLTGLADDDLRALYATAFGE